MYSSNGPTLEGWAYIIPIHGPLDGPLYTWAQYTPTVLTYRRKEKQHKNLSQLSYSLRNFCAIEAASATRLSSENRGESSIRSPGVLLNSIRYCNRSIFQFKLTTCKNIIPWNYLTY